MAGPEIERLIKELARLPGLGPRSAKRAALYLLKRRESLLLPMISALESAAREVKICSICGNYDSREPCSICSDPGRDDSVICVIEDVSGLWAMERAGQFKGRYHVLGGVLSALDGIGPNDLAIERLILRASAPAMREIILATGATVDGQTTAHYIADRLAGRPVNVTGLAHGVPMGGEIDYLDDGTIGAALKARRTLV